MVHVRDREGAGEARLGLVVPRAVGSAVERNRVKRRIRAIWQEVSCSAAPVDCVVVVRPEARTAGFPALAAQLEGSLRTMRVLRACPEGVASE